MFCEHCGFQIRDDASFCPRCGAPVQNRAVSNAYVPPAPPVNAVPPAPAPKKSGGGSKALLISIIAVAASLVIVVGAILFFVLRGAVSGVIRPAPDQIPQPAAVSSAEDDGDKQQETAAPATEAPEPTEKKDVEAATRFVKATASSTLDDQAGHSYDASNVLEDDGTCWCEDASDYGEGEWIRLDLPELQKVSGLYIMNGYAGTEKQYDSNSKLSRIRLEFSNGTYIETELETLKTRHRKNVQKIQFGEPVETEYVKIIILSVDEAEYKDTCLTYVEPF